MRNKYVFDDQTKKLPLILGIDTSCDETSASVTLGRMVLSNVIASQTNIHQPYGGVYPSLAKQAHQEKIMPVIRLALKRAGVDFVQLDVIAVTLGPGLAPALEVGINQAKKLAHKWHKPLITVNHVEAHMLSVLLQRKSQQMSIKKLLRERTGHPNISINYHQQPEPAIFPVLGLVLSGGHSQFVQINNFGNYEVLGETIDDAVGEALDKVGRMLGLGYPAAPVMEKLARQGDPDKFKFPLPLTTVNDFNLSYSGLKTAAHRLIKSLEAENKLTQQTILDLSASFQHAVFRHLAYKLNKLLEHRKQKNKQQQGKLKKDQLRKNEQQKDKQFFSQVWLGGGVASNINLRQTIRRILRPYNIELQTPFEKRLCGDNAAMIALTAGYKMSYTRKNYLQAQLKDLDRKPSWRI